MIEQTRKCPICDRAYLVFPMYAGDQSACADCRAEARKAVVRPDTIEQAERRRRHFQ